MQLRVGHGIVGTADPVLLAYQLDVLLSRASICIGAMYYQRSGLPTHTSFTIMPCSPLPCSVLQRTCSGTCCTCASA